MQCPQCGAEHSPEQGRFCAVCGLPVSEAAPMTCPHCGAAYSPEQGRFCDACGLALPVSPRKADAVAPGGTPAAKPRKRPEEDELPRCRACGTATDAPVCPTCGNRMPSRED